MKKQFSCLGLGFLFFTSIASAETDFTSTCQVHQDSVTWNSCVFTTVGSTSPDVVFYLHGIGGSEQEWATFHGLNDIRDSWTHSGQQAPRIVTVSFGKAWLLAEKNSSKNSGLFELFTESVLPALEQELGGIKGRKILFGLSMGGFNAVQILLKKPKLFSKVVLACPALTHVSPYDSNADIQAYIDRTHADPLRVLRAVALARITYPDAKTWQTGDPFLLGNSLIGADSPPVLIHVGTEDEYGFFEGDQAFAELIQEKSTNELQWVLMKGGHCTFDAEKIAQFISN